jgi:small-conductance mechanosensitive channel
MAGALNAFIILLLADFLWHAAKLLIDRRVTAAAAQDDLDEDELRRRARIRTLMPILRNMLMVVLVAMTAMMALSQLGVEIAPLIAGAGVMGVAIGFGAQTLVRDVISGIFYLIDDAFRVGEYIQSSSYKGTVESFSLRSVKLRHHRGPLYTVPFGSLGAIQNMSRDWVIDKLKIGVTYDSDTDLAKKIVKQVGRELLEDPEFKPNIIETLKMQGVETLGDFAIELRLKMKTKPGEQFVIRRRALALIKKRFDAAGIRFAFPVVQIAGGAGGDAAAAAAAKQVLDRAAADGRGSDPGV